MGSAGLAHAMGIPRPAHPGRRRVWPASPSHVKCKRMPGNGGVFGGHVAVASGSSTRPRIPKTSMGLPSLGRGSQDPRMGPVVRLRKPSVTLGTVGGGIWTTHLALGGDRCGTKPLSSPCRGQQPVATERWGCGSAHFCAEVHIAPSIPGSPAHVFPQGLPQKTSPTLMGARKSAPCRLPRRSPSASSPVEPTA